MPRDPSVLTGLKAFEREKVWTPTERALNLGLFFPPLDDPAVVGAAEARFMRDDDQVLGLEFRGEARAYPIWVVDYYHAVNDAVAGAHILVAHCDRCMSGNAFLADVDGQRLKFRVFGIHNAALVVQDLQSRSIWLHYEGIALGGAKAGTILEQIPTYHMTWAEWKGLHPDTGVVVPHDPRHRDPRHGHGRAESLDKAHMSQKFKDTVVGGLDLRLPENELCLFVSVGGAVRAYPVGEVKRVGGVAHDTIAGLGVVVLSGPRIDSFAMAAFERRVDSTCLTFVTEDDRFRDLETGSAWTIDGRCVDGPMRGARLRALDFYFLRWHAWAWSHPNTEIWTGPSEDVAGFALGEFAPIVSTLAGRRFAVRVRGEVLELIRPLGAERGLSLTVDGDPFGLYRFTDAVLARDFEYLEGHCLRRGRFVIRSEPELFADHAHVVRLPEDTVAWSALLGNRRFIEAFVEALAGEHVEPAGIGFREIYEGLKDRGHRIEDVPSLLEGGGRTTERFITRSQLRVNALSGVLVGIDGDPFIVYLFKDNDSAKAYCGGEARAFCVDRFVLRSTPSDMYTTFEIRDRPDEKVSWSRLLVDESFHRELREIIALSSAAAR